MNLFIFGAGYSGRAFGRLLAARGVPVAGTTRQPAKAAALREAGIEPLIFNDSAPIASLVERLGAVTHLVQSIAPGDHGDPVLAAFAETILHAMPKLEWIGYLSTVGVYGDRKGAWVDETNELNPRPGRSIDRVKAERAWLELAARAGKPAAILRLSGIYGPGRNAFVNLANGTARRLVKPDQVFNRIHVDDIAGALDHLAARREGGVFNVTDDRPAPPQDVVAFAAKLMGVAPPPEIPFDAAELSPMARSFYGENKRVSNARLKESGYALRYPDYQTAFTAMWRAGDWADPDPRPRKD